MDDSAATRERGRFDNVVVPVDCQRVRLLVDKNIKECEKVLGVQIGCRRGKATRHIEVTDDLDAVLARRQFAGLREFAIAPALENNLDLAIARYNLPIADTDILRAKAGQGLLGVPTGLVQGTPGGQSADRPRRPAGAVTDPAAAVRRREREIRRAARLNTRRGRPRRGHGGIARFRPR